MDDRLVGLTDWVRQFAGFEQANPVPASADASFRRYFRVQGDVSCIVMDAPPPQEDCAPFVRIADYLEKMGLHSPRVLQADLARGYLLLSDLGSLPYLTEIEARPERASPLYMDALDALLVMQSNGRAVQGNLPAYDDELLRKEMLLFRDWLCQRHLDLLWTDDDERAWQSLCDTLVVSALGQPKVFVHRDFHSRNLMFAEFDNPGILDFQDAVEGPATYDLVSLLKDCYVKWPAEQTLERALYFHEYSGVVGHQPQDRFIRDFDLMGVQRHLKASGIFARLLHRDGKAGYMKDVPRTLSYIVDVAPQYEELEFLGDLITGRILPALEKGC